MNPLIIHHLDNTEISQRSDDGYINATAMCQAAGKKLSHYLANQTTKDYLEELSRSAGIPADHLIVTKTTGRNEERGTWIHPDIAANLGQWCSAKFAVAVSRWVREWMSGKPAIAEVPKDPMSVIEALNVALEQARAAETYRQSTLALANHAVAQKAEIQAKAAVIELQAKDVELLHDLMRDPAKTLSLAQAAPIIIPEWCQGSGGQNKLAEILRAWGWLLADLRPHSCLRGRGYFVASGWSPTAGGTWETVASRLTHKAVADARRKILTEGYPASIQLPKPKKNRKDVRSTGYLEGFEPQAYVDPEDVLRPGEVLGPDVGSLPTPPVVP